MTLRIRRATASDAAMLAQLGAQTFRDTFGSDNTESDMTEYLAVAFGESIQLAELCDARYFALVAERDGETAGYALLRSGPAPPEVTACAPLEVARVYVVRHAQGSGVGAMLMQRCLDEAGARGHDVVWLGVWEHNPRAIAFYMRWGFADVGSHAFTLGRDRQTDRLMMRRVARENRCDTR